MNGLSITRAALLLTIVESIADYSAKSQNLPLTIVSYAGLGYVLLRTLKENPLGTQNLQWNAMTNVTDLALGSFFFGENLDVSEWVAGSLITTGILLLAYKSK